MKSGSFSSYRAAGALGPQEPDDPPPVRQPQIIDILTALIDERGAIVSSADCSEMEITFARSEGRFYVDNAGFGFVLRMREWRANAEAALADVADLHRTEKEES
jgi:hypothetical protein